VLLVRRWTRLRRLCCLHGFHSSPAFIVAINAAQTPIPPSSLAPLCFPFRLSFYLRQSTERDMSTVVMHFDFDTDWRGIHAVSAVWTSECFRCCRPSYGCSSKRCVIT
jgi:hypothetical protein